MSVDGYDDDYTKQQLELQLSPPSEIDNLSTITTQDKYYEFELDGKIINLRLLSIGNHPKNTTSPGVSLTIGEEMLERTLTAKEMQRNEKKENIFHLIHDCLV